MQNAKSLKFILGVIGVIGIIGATKKVEQSRSTLDFRNIFTPKKSQSERFFTASRRWMRPSLLKSPQIYGQPRLGMAWSYPQVSHHQQAFSR